MIVVLFCFSHFLDYVPFVQILLPLATKNLGSTNIDP